MQKLPAEIDEPCAVCGRTAEFLFEDDFLCSGCRELVLKALKNIKEEKQNGESNRAF